MKQALTFLSGSVVSAIAVVLSGGHPAILFWLGATVTATALGAILWLLGIRRTARLLNAFADAWSSAQEPFARTKQSPSLQVVEKSANQKSSGYVKPSKKQQLQILADTVEEYHHSKETDEFLSDPELFGEKKGRVA